MSQSVQRPATGWKIRGSKPNEDEIFLTSPECPKAYQAPCRGQLKCDGTGAETRFLLSAKRRGLFKSARASVQSPTAAEVCASAVVMLDTTCSEVV